MRTTLASLALSFLLAGCPASMVADLDAGGSDAPRADDAPPGLDAPGLDAPGLDAPAADAPRVDGCIPSCEGRGCGDDGCGGSCGGCLPGATCTAAGRCDCPVATCGTRACGASTCGRPCGICDVTESCFMGACTTTACPGTSCRDRMFRRICEGQAGLGRCTTNPAFDAVCLCTGAGEDLACDACIDDGTEPAIGVACDDESDCPAGVACTIGLCGEPCSPVDSCATGVCYVPGDFSGVCLTPCACDVPGTCPTGTVCVDGLGAPSSACVDDARTFGATCSSGG
jgi:hypothetical protein